MKNILFLLILLSIISCKENATSVSKQKPCNLPPQYTDNNNAPVVTGHIPIQLSPDGKKLIFIIDDAVIKVLDLKN